MSKIDLSKAKVGDKFRTRKGKIMEYIGESRSNNQYILKDERDIVFYFYKEGNHTLIIENKYDLIEQVFDKGDLLDNNISGEEIGQAIVEMAKSEYEKAKELGVAIQNLPNIVEQPKEDNHELQRRQEVVELADRLLFMNRMHDAYNDYIEELNNENLHTLMSFPLYILQCAEDFIKYKNQYLKEGKL